MRVIVVFLAVSCIFQVSLGGSTHDAALIVGDTEYFYDDSTTLRTWTQAEAYCASNKACLAVINNESIYEVITRWLPVNTTFWIDGKDKNSQERFQLTSPCGGSLDLPNLNAASVTCLSIVKGADLLTSSIQANLCNVTARTLCSVSLFGITTTAASPITDPITTASTPPPPVNP